jgi:hypothetical protein
LLQKQIEQAIPSHKLTADQTKRLAKLKAIIENRRLRRKDKKELNKKTKEFE